MTAAAPPTQADRAVAAHRAVLIVFALAGVAFSAWASRIADAKHSLGLSAGELGATLLFLSAGSILGMPSAGRIAHRVGAAMAVRLGMIVSLVGFVVLGLGVDVAHNRWAAAPGLMLIGLGVGVWDVSMNLEGAAVERLLGRTTMPLYHAAFSGGTVASAVLGAALSWADVPVLVHLVVAGLAVLAAGVVALRSFLPRTAEEAVDPLAEGESAGAAAVRPPAVKPRSAWLEPRTLLIGFVMLAAAFTEGTANDWLSVAFVEGHETARWAGVLGFAVFLTFMTLGRIAGTRWLDTYGRVPVLRVLFVLAVIGSLLVIFGNTALAYVGAAIWGVGAALGFPVGISASADDPKRAAARMATVSTLAYGAFLAGPPLLGFLGDHYGVLRSLLVVSAMLAMAFLILPVVREPQPPRLVR